MSKYAYIGLDVHKETIVIAVADNELHSEVRFWGSISNTLDDLKRLVNKLKQHHAHLEFVYEAGPCGYVIYRQLLAWGETCSVVAPSHIPRRPTDRIKNDHRDAVNLARLARAGELTQVWVPNEMHEAMRDLIRVRHSISADIKKVRQRIQSFLLRYDKRYDKKPWTVKHRVWLANQKFEHGAQQIAFQHYLNALERYLSNRDTIDQSIHELLPQWSLAPLVHALQALRGVAVLIAVTIAAEVGDISRFSHPKQLMAYLGLVPSEHSSGGKIKPRGITKTGNAQIRALLVEAAWSYCQRPKVGAYKLSHRPKDLPASCLDISWQAQLRLHKRYQRLLARGKLSQVAITAVARELLGFMWAIACEVTTLAQV